MTGITQVGQPENGQMGADSGSLGRSDSVSQVSASVAAEFTPDRLSDSPTDELAVFAVGQTRRGEAGSDRLSNVDLILIFQGLLGARDES